MPHRPPAIWETRPVLTSRRPGSSDIESELGQRIELIDISGNVRGKYDAAAKWLANELGFEDVGIVGTANWGGVPHRLKEKKPSGRPLLIARGLPTDLDQNGDSKAAVVGRRKFFEYELDLLGVWVDGQGLVELIYSDPELAAGLHGVFPQAVQTQLLHDDADACDDDRGNRIRVAPPGLETGRVFFTKWHPNEESEYGDLDGSQYSYRNHQSTRLDVGDLVVCARLKSASTADAGTIVGVGRVGLRAQRSISETEREEKNLVERMKTEYVVHFDGYEPAPDERLWADIVGEHAASFQQSSVIDVDRRYGDLAREMLSAAGLAEISELTPVPVAFDQQQFFGKAPPAEEAPALPTPSSPVTSFGSRDTLVSSPDWLAETTLLDREVLDEMVDTLRKRRPQIVLAGPPGTGKTWVAQNLATHLTEGRSGATRVLQFHPTYSYEDFVEGIRPVSKDGQILFEPVSGPIVELAEMASEVDHPVVLIIDEMNRGNLPTILGELLHLLEYRGPEHAIGLLHRREFSLPRNLYLIGTMNTADRSIRSIDSALRRRFDLFELPASLDVLSRFHDRVEGTSPAVPDLMDGFRELNERLGTYLDRHHAIGHTFFMQPGFDATELRRVWERQIFPLIEEYFFDQPDIAQEFVLKDLWPSVRTS